MFVKEQPVSRGDDAIAARAPPIPCPRVLVRPAGPPEPARFPANVQFTFSVKSRRRKNKNCTKCI